MNQFELGLQPASTAVAEIGRLSELADWDYFFVSVAYATVAGCEQLVGELRTRWAGFSDATKMFCVGLDFGLTEPRAIVYLQNLPNASVRLYSPELTIKRKLRPNPRFHPKIYWVMREAAGSSRAAGLVGSCNLTGSGLTTNAESFAVFDVDSASDEGKRWLEKLRLQRAATARMSLAAPHLLRDYSRLRRRQPRLSVAPEPPPAVGAPQAELSPELLRALSAARFLWTQTLKIVPNRGPNRPGNQVDLKKGVRWFFDIRVPLGRPLNTPLGTITVHYRGVTEACNLRFGNNGMDKVNLPLADAGAGYDHAYLCWERVGGGEFRLRTSRAGQRWRKASEAEGTIFPYSASRRFWGIFNDPAAV